MVIILQQQSKKASIIVIFVRQGLAFRVFIDHVNKAHYSYLLSYSVYYKELKRFCQSNLHESQLFRTNRILNAAIPDLSIGDCSNSFVNFQVLPDQPGKTFSSSSMGNSSSGMSFINAGTTAWAQEE